MAQHPVSSASLPRPNGDSRPGERIIVIGAGVAGLVVAYELARAGVPVTLVEASDRVGGQLAAVRIAGIDVDAAAESFATRGGTVASLVADLGLGDDLVVPRESPAWLIGGRGRAHPLPAASVLGIPADPREPDVRAAIGRAAAWRARLDSVAPLRRPESYRSVGELVRRRMGARVLDRLVAPVVRGVYSTSPESLTLERAGLAESLRASRSLGVAVGRLRSASPAGSQVAGLRGGVFRLAESLERAARAAGAEVLCGARVAAVDAGGVRLDDGRSLVGGIVHAAAGIAGTATRSRTVTVAIAAVDAPELDSAPRGTGALVDAGAAGIAARAFTHSTAKWQWLADELPAHRHIVRLSYDEMPEDAEATVAADLRAITGVPIGRLIDLDVRTWTRTLEVRPADFGYPLVGEAASLTGLAAIVGAARSTAERMRTAGTGAPATTTAVQTIDARAARPDGTEG